MDIEATMVRIRVTGHIFPEADPQCIESQGAPWVILIYGHMTLYGRLWLFPQADPQCVKSQRIHANHIISGL